MFEGLSPLARDARSWPFEQARALLARILRLRLSDAERDLAFTLINSGKADEAVKTFPALAKPVILETGYGPSGLPHLGTFGEVARTTMVRSAFRALTDDAIPTRLIAFSDDMDGLRKVPDNIENKQPLIEDLGKPLTVVRDPFGTHDSFGAHNNARLRAFLDGFGFDYEFVSSTECYKGGLFDETLLTALARFDAIQKVMLPTLGEERRASYSPFLPISPSTGKVLQVPTLERNVDKGTIVFQDEDGAEGRGPGDRRPREDAVEARLGHALDGAGRRLRDERQGPDRLGQGLGPDLQGAGRRPPEGFNYELFLDENSQKISKSKGNGLSMEDWLRYGAPESLSYYMFQSPKSAKKLYFDVIPKATDEYLQQLDAYPEAGAGQAAGQPGLARPSGRPPQYGSPVSFSLMLNLVSAANASDKAILWGFLSRYIPGATPESQPLLDRLAGYAINYYDDFVKPTKAFRAPDDKERAAILDLLARLKALPSDCQDAELIQNEVFAVGKDHEFEPLRAWFQALYEVLLGQSQGPRFGSFAAIFGLDRTTALIEEKLG
jgi:lysyl-tRNA synthetase class 1